MNRTLERPYKSHMPASLWKASSPLLLSAVSGAVFCTLFCALLCLSVVRGCESAFYRRTAAIAAVFPQDAGQFMDALKDPQSTDLAAGRSLLAGYGYRGQLLGHDEVTGLIGLCLLFVILFTGMLLLFKLLRDRRLALRVKDLTLYLHQVEAGVYPVLPRSGEDRFSRLEDELGKTVAALRESRESALSQKENMARNLENISHQLKTPLTGISILSELLAASAPDRNQKQSAEKITRLNDRMTALTTTLLALARLDAGAICFDLCPNSISDLLSCVSDSVLPMMEQKKQALRLPDPGDGMLYCDLGWTGEALANLIKNCQEHAPSGSSVTVRLEQTPLFTQFIIEDEGPGFAPEDLPHLFDRFYLGSSTVKGGAGIGLSLAKSVIERQGGVLKAGNRPGKGAFFEVRFYPQIG